MTPHQKNDWREEKIGELTHFLNGMYGFGSQNEPDAANICHRECIDWLETLLTQQAERIAEEVEGIAFGVDQRGRRHVFLEDLLTVIRKK